MIARDCHPFSIVDDDGFRSLINTLEPRYNIPSRKYFTETIMPKIYEGMKSVVGREVAGVSNFSLTTDIWSTDLNTTSLLSLTAHWLASSFERRSVVLNAIHFDGSHTGEAISDMIQNILGFWKIPINNIHLILRDNASNMIKGMRDAGIPDLGCFAHSLQLVVHDGVLSQRVVIDMLTTARKIVGHFRRSNLAYSNLKKIQMNLNLPLHRLIQDEPTRWNSTLYMLQRLMEQKMALAAYASEYTISQLTQNQLTIASKVIKVLSIISN